MDTCTNLKLGLASLIATLAACGGAIEPTDSHTEKRAQPLNVGTRGFLLANGGSHPLLALSYASIANGTALAVQPFTGAKTQQWQIENLCGGQFCNQWKLLATDPNGTAEKPVCQPSGANFTISDSCVPQVFGPYGGAIALWNAQNQLVGSMQSLGSGNRVAKSTALDTLAPGRRWYFHGFPVALGSWSESNAQQTAYLATPLPNNIGVLVGASATLDGCLAWNSLCTFSPPATSQAWGIFASGLSATLQLPVHSAAPQCGSSCTNAQIQWYTGSSLVNWADPSAEQREASTMGNNGAGQPWGLQSAVNGWYADTSVVDDETFTDPAGWGVWQIPAPAAGM